MDVSPIPSKVLGGQLCQLLLVKHNNETSAAFREDVRQYGLAFKKDNPGLRDELMYNQASLQTVVDNGIDGLRTEAQRKEYNEIRQENQRQAVGVDGKLALPLDEDRGEGEVKGSLQPKIASLDGIEVSGGQLFASDEPSSEVTLQMGQYDTGNS